MTNTADSEDLKNYDMNDFLRKFKISNIDEVIVEVKLELEFLKDLILKENPCHVFFPGRKSIDLYSSIFEDLIKAHFTIGMIDIIHNKYLSASPNIDNIDKCIMVVDSSNSGTEIDTLLSNVKAEITKIYSNLSSLISIERITESHDINEENIIALKIVEDSEEYRDIIIRNKLYGNAMTSDESLGCNEIDHEYVIDIVQEEFIELLQFSIRELMKCDKIKLIKDPLMNTKSPKRITKYFHDCNCLHKECMKWFNFITTEKFCPIIPPEVLTLLCRIEERDVGYKLGIIIDYPFDYNVEIYDNYKECGIFKNITNRCLFQNLILKDDEYELQIVKKSRACANCLDNNILNLIKEDILELVGQKIDSLTI